MKLLLTLQKDSERLPIKKLRKRKRAKNYKTFTLKCHKFCHKNIIIFFEIYLGTKIHKNLRLKFSLRLKFC